MNNERQQETAEPAKRQRRIADYISINPLAPIRRAATSVAHTAKVLADKKNEMAASLPTQGKPGLYSEGDLRNIADAKERFVAMYQNNDWTEPQLLTQIAVCRRTKIFALILAILGVTGIIVLAVKTPAWIAILLTFPASLCLLLGVGKSFQFALYEAQLKLRELISAREFVARPDFFVRFFG